MQILSCLLQLLQDCPVSPVAVQQHSSSSSSTPPVPAALRGLSHFFLQGAQASIAWLCCNALGRNPPAPLSGACLAAGGPRNLPLLQPLCSPSTEFDSLCIPRAALHVREEELLLPGATLHQHSPFLPSGPIPMLCLPAAGRELPPLPASSCLSCISGSLPAATWIHFCEQ